jgi:hypothetical protein
MPQNLRWLVLASATAAGSDDACESAAKGEGRPRMLSDSGFEIHLVHTTALRNGDGLPDTSTMNGCHVSHGSCGFT